MQFSSSYSNGDHKIRSGGDQVMRLRHLLTIIELEANVLDDDKWRDIISTKSMLIRESLPINLNNFIELNMLEELNDGLEKKSINFMSIRDNESFTNFVQELDKGHNWIQKQKTDKSIGLGDCIRVLRNKGIKLIRRK